MPAGDVAGLDVSNLIGTVVTPVIVIGLMLARKLVTGGELTDLKKQLETKDAALIRKDEQIQTLQVGLSQEVIPALTRATDVIKAYQSQVVVPRANP